MFKLSKRSLTKLEGVHEELVRVIKRSIEITTVDFVVLEGLRTVERQKELYFSGASKTMRSRHLTGHAVDLAPWIGEVRWDWPLFHKLAPSVKHAANELGVSIEWGGDWKTFKDGPHFQLTWEAYP